MSEQQKRKNSFEMESMIEEIDGQRYEYFPLGKYVVAARGVSGGRPTIKYRRLDARYVLASVNSGMTVRQVAREYSIPIAAVNEVVALANRYDYEARYINGSKNTLKNESRHSKLQAVYDELSEEGKILFDISFNENRDPSEFMTTTQINAEIARRRGSVSR